MVKLPTVIVKTCLSNSEFRREGKTVVGAAPDRDTDEDLCMQTQTSGKHVNLIICFLRLSRQIEFKRVKSYINFTEMSLVISKYQKSKELIWQDNLTHE